MRQQAPQPRANLKMTRRALLRAAGLSALASTLAACSTAPGATSAPEPDSITEAPQARAHATDTRQPGSGADETKPQPTVTSAQAAEPQAPGASAPAAGQAYLAVARGEDPASITEKALLAIGGMERFVKQGYDVIIKPNICTDYYTYEYGATTNPVVVATLVRLALGAGAKRVRVMDYPFGGSAESAYARSGIEAAVKEAGGEMELMNPNKFRKTAIPGGRSIQEWPVYQEVLKADLLIDVPIAKHHSLARVTLGGKNLMGVIENRGGIHAELGARIADLVSLVRPGLVVVDAVRTLMRNGPTGGSLDDVKLNNTVIASHDIVAADAYGATLFDLTGEDISYVKACAEAGLGTLDLKSIQIEEISA